LKFVSRQTGDGGLTPEQLVFTEKLEKFAGATYAEVFRQITGNRASDAFNVGGPIIDSGEGEKFKIVMEFENDY
jgi:hypothetical protein